jgi:conjugative relaxase-like TrwC/TraI family protein
MLKIEKIFKNHSYIIKSKINTEELNSFSWYGKGAESLVELNNENINKLDIENILNNTYKDLELRPLTNYEKEVLAINSIFFVSDLMSYVCVSLKETKIEEAFDKSVNETLDYIESLSQERTYKNNIPTKNNTYNLLILKIKNLYSQGNKKELLNTHCLIMNTTKDKDGNFKSLSSDLIFRNISNIKKTFNLNLEKNLKSVGYDTFIDEKGNVEIVGYDQYKYFIKERNIAILNETKKRIENEKKVEDYLDSFNRTTESNNDYSDTASNYNYSSSSDSSLLMFIPSVIS